MVLLISYVYNNYFIACSKGCIILHVYMNFNEIKRRLNPFR